MAAVVRVSETTPDERSLEVLLIIVAYRSDPWIEPCVSSLVHSTKSPLHLMLVDNAENTRLDALDFAGHRHSLIRSQSLLGFAEANNLALRQLEDETEFIVFLNQDTVSETDWVTDCIEALRRHPDYAAVTPMTLAYEGKDYERYFLECAGASSAFAMDLDTGHFSRQVYEVPVIPAAAMVVRASALRQVGPFDPVFGSYYEDYDLCYRLGGAGYHVGVCATACVRHFSGSASQDRRAEERRARWVTRNRLIVRQRFETENRPLGLLKHWLLEFPRGLLRSLARRPGAKPLGPYLSAHWDIAFLTPRLLSASVDESAWATYLEQISWSPIPGRRQEQLL